MVCWFLPWLIKSVRINSGTITNMLTGNIIWHIVTLTFVLLNTVMITLILQAAQKTVSLLPYPISKLSNVRQKRVEFLIQKIYFALEVTWSKYCNWPLVYWFSGVPWSTSGCFLRYNSLKDSELKQYIIIWGEDDEDQRGFSETRGRRLVILVISCIYFS